MECSRPNPVIAFRFPSEPAAGARKQSSGMGWPLGLRSCVVAQAMSPLQTVAARTWLQARVEEAPAQQNMAFHFAASFSDPSVSSESDSDLHSETASSSFFKDSRRITLGSLIGLHVESSGRAGMHLETGYNRRRQRTFRFAMASKTCGIRELLGCANCMQLVLEENLSEDLTDPEPIALSQSHADCLELERHTAVPELEGGNQAATLGGRIRTSPEWSASQFVSCNSVLSDAQESLQDERYRTDQAATPFSNSTISTSTGNSNETSRLQRSLSMKSFLSTICCHI